MLNTHWRSRGYLPHYDAPSAPQHIAFGLADALPGAVAGRTKAMPPWERLNVVEAALDAGYGRRTLGDPRAARIVADALLHFDEIRYDLVAWCVMPTHVHALVVQRDAWELKAIVHAWKSFTANAVNRTFGLSGPLWSREYFDRVARNDEHLLAVRTYIENNPVAAGLSATIEEWPWSSAARAHD